LGLFTVCEIVRDNGSLKRTLGERSQFALYLPRAATPEFQALTLAEGCDLSGSVVAARFQRDHWPPRRLRIESISPLREVRPDTSLSKARTNETLEPIS
jgi:hypothetical protein